VKKGDVYSSDIDVMVAGTVTMDRMKKTVVRQGNNQNTMKGIVL